jgi:ubiquinone/menaquinone biosynthesis C-methylase UbiE
MNKTIHRDPETTTKIFEDRSVETDFSTILPLLKNGMQVLDVGCGTGAISSGIADFVGPMGRVVGIDNTAEFIKSGKINHGAIHNLELICCDLFSYAPESTFDLIVSARTLQWLNNPKEALLKLKTFLKPGGQLSVLDYNHEALEWKPEPPDSMKLFYETFLRWRKDAGLNNHIAEDLADYFAETGFCSIELYQADEIYSKKDENFLDRIGIWSKVAGSKQMVEEGYITDELRIKAVKEYDVWIAEEAEQMTMKLKEVRGKV